MMKFDGKPCECCGTPTRTMYPVPASSGKKNTRLQHTRWWVCENGHKLYRKRG